MEGEEGVFVVCSQAEGAVCGAWRRALRTPGLFLLSGPGKNTHTSKRYRRGKTASRAFARPLIRPCDLLL